VTYARGGSLESVRARTVIWAGACWSAKHAVQHAPDEYRVAMNGYPRSPMLVVNVALDNWRALYNLGYSAISWRGGFGFTANLRAPMHVGSYQPPFDPDQPTVLTFYVPFNQRGLGLVEQGVAGRATLYGTSYRDYEKQIRQQLSVLLGGAGFDAGRDIAGIVINRWGHAYVTAGPGFYTGRDGHPPPSEVLRRPLGNLTFAHSELSGTQSMGPAVAEGNRAALQVVQML
jgi:spermidine dehydrogenase